MTNQGHDPRLGRNGGGSHPSRPASSRTTSSGISSNASTRRTSISATEDDEDTTISRKGRNYVEGNDHDTGGGWGRNAALGLAAAGGLSLFAAAPFVLTQIRSPLPYMATPRRKVVAALNAIASGRLNTTVANQKGNVSCAVGSCGGGGHAPRRRWRYLHLTDLGSGDGEAVLAAVSTECAGGRGWTATGIELNPTLWAVSCLRRWTSMDADGRRRTRFVWGDMFNLLSANSSSSSSLLPPAASKDAGLATGAGAGGGGGGPQSLLGSSDAVMIFGVKSLMGRVAGLLRDGGAEPGTYVLSYRFRLPILEGGEGPPSPPSTGDGGGEIDDEDGEEGRIDATLVYDVEDMRIYVLNNGDDCGVDDDDDDGGGGPVGRGA